MTKLGAASGRVKFPYNPSNDNHYAIATTKKDVLQCKVSITRNVNNEYFATVSDSTGKTYGSATRTLSKAQEVLIVPGEEGIESLAIIATGPAGKVGDVGSRIDFNYGARAFGSFELGTGFAWTTVSTGTDSRFHDNNPDTSIPGGYCSVQKIEDSPPQPPNQLIVCYFPCNAP